MNMKWWIARIVFLRWWTGCGGEGYYDAGRETASGIRDVTPCRKTGCH